jgi:hypothetical protein
MIEEKIIPLHELKYYYDNHLGFVFKGVIPSSNDAIQRLAKNLISWKVSEKLPEFYTRVSSNEVAFIYSGDSGFRSADFFQYCNRLNVMGMFSIDTLSNWIKSSQ